MNILVKSHPFQRRTMPVEFHDGVSLAEVSGHLARPQTTYEFAVNGEPIPPDQFATTIIHEADHVVAYRVPEDGALGIAAFIMAAFNPAFLVTFAGSFAVTRNFDKSVQLASTIGFGPLGPLASLAILGSRKPNVPNGTDPLAHSLTGIGNQPDPFGVVPKNYGRIRIFPKFPGRFPTQYTEIVGDDQYLRGYVLIGKGPGTVSDIRLGETSIDNFDDVEYQVFEGKATDPVNTLYTRDVSEESLAVDLPPAGSFQVRTTQLNTTRISVDWTHPKGVNHFKKDGSREAHLVTVEIQYKLTTEESYTSLGTFDTLSATTTAIRKNHSWDVPAGQYDVGLRRTTGAGSAGVDINDTVWTALRSIRNETPFTEPECAGIAFRMRATDQLNGIIDNLNCIWEADLSTYGPAGWGTPLVTQSPAWAVADILTGNGNKRPLAKSRLNGDSFKAFADFCTTNGFTFNYAFDQETTVFEAANFAAAVGRGSLDNVDGQYVIIFDAQQTVIRDHFTPRTIWDFEGQAAYPERPDAYRVAFRNEDIDFQEDERPVYDDGFDEATATTFDFRQYPGITDPDHAWKHGRWEMAATQLRFEEWTFKTDFRRLIVTRGDLCVLAHDVMLVGLGWGRIKSVESSGGLVSAIRIDTDAVMETGQTYGVQVQKSLNNSTLEGQVVTVAGTTRRLQFVTPISGEAPAVGDLVTFGIWGQISQRVIIKAIQPIRDNGNLAAQITVVAEAPGVYTAHLEEIPDHTPIITIPSYPQNLRPPTPFIRAIRSDETASPIGDSGSFNATLTVSVGFLSGFSQQMVYIQAQYRLWIDEGSPTLGTPHPWITTTMEPGENGEILIPNVHVSLLYEVRIRSLNKLNTSLISPWSASQTHNVLGDTLPPGVVTNVTGQAMDRTVSIRWTNPQDENGNTEVDFAATEVWRSPADDFGQSPSQAVYIGETAGEVFIDEKLTNETTYYYGLKARDWAGNLSDWHSAGHSPAYAGLAITPTANVVVSKAEARLASKTLQNLEDVLTLNYTAKGGTIRVRAKLFVYSDGTPSSPPGVCDIQLELNGTFTADSYEIDFDRIGPGYPGEISLAFDDTPSPGAQTYSIKYAGSTQAAQAINLGIFVEEVET